MMVARAAGVALTEVSGAQAKQETGALIERLSQQGMTLTYPVLETSDGDLVTESPAICHFLSASGNASHLMGSNPFEQALVDQWVIFLRTKTLPLTKTLAAAVYGTLEVTADEHAFITNELKENLKTVNNQLKSK